MSSLTSLQVSETIAEVTLAPVSRIDLIKYSGASGDYNPIHTIDEEAKKAGLPGIIAHGMWTMGNLSKLFTSYLEDGFIEKYHIRFKGMVLLDDIVTLKGTLIDRKEDVLFFEVSAINQHGKIVIIGEVHFHLY